MFIDGYTFMVDNAAKFYNVLRLAGWFYHPSDRLAGVDLVGQPLLGRHDEINIPHRGVEAALGPDRGFAAQFLRAGEQLPPDAAITFRAESGWTATVPLLDLCADRLAASPGHDFVSRFVKMLDAMPGARVLDIGGRDRSRNDGSASFGQAEVVVLDIHPGANVDIVADAHAIPDSVPSGSFDAVYSVAVFEHLLMPWAVVPQINRVLKPGGLVMVTSHQTVGMHDVPWDFWRFSDTAWDALFNRHTGFEIVERVLDVESFVIPFVYRPSKAWNESSVGFERSGVIARKVGPCRLGWPVTPAEIIASSYPAGTEDPFEKKS